MNRTDWQTFRDIREASAQPYTAAPMRGFGGNVGDMMAVMLAAAGAYAPICGGSTPCETDYLAASGATFPASVTREEMEAFNRATLREVMDEAAEMRRYTAIAGFFGRASA